METINIIDKEKEAQIREQAKQYANSEISTDPHTNWMTIYTLKREVLSMTEGQSQINLDMMKREKKREKQHQEEIEKLKNQIESLAQQVGRLSKNNN
jgi:hypothetical protein